MATVRFKSKGKWVSFTAKATPKAKAPARKRRGPPKGKVPAHLKPFLFKAKTRRSRR